MPASGEDELATIEFHSHGDRLLAVLAGEVDMSNADDIGVRLRSACNGAGGMVLDLSQLTFLDSHGIAAIFDLHREMADDHLGLEVIARPDSMVARVLDLTGLTQILPITYTDAGAARD